ncbi:MAG TPA: hypothetical protein VFX16_30395 [Pseudonocardiaceae bacterium]|nr:hypothetical protein [Pseudonocardiaceae bacterium]
MKLSVICVSARPGGPLRLCDRGPDQLLADVIPFPSAAATTTDTTSRALSNRPHDVGDGEPEGTAS